MTLDMFNRVELIPNLPLDKVIVNVFVCVCVCLWSADFEAIWPDPAFDLSLLNKYWPLPCI